MCIGAAMIFLESRTWSSRLAAYASSFMDAFGPR
jgi:hypothetical protein